VLFVCTGNICRSPLAEQLFRSRTVGGGVLLSTSSAGTDARVGERMTPQAAALSLRYGGDPSQHRAVPIGAALIRESGLILTATRRHRAEVVSLVPRASRYTFTLREFARLVEAPRETDAVGQPAIRTGPGFDLEEFVRDAASLRGHGPVMPTAADDDIVDPYRREQAVYDEAGSLIDEAITAITRAIVAAGGPASPRRSARS
jgi:protein-tyrosine phosphatase